MADAGQLLAVRVGDVVLGAHLVAPMSVWGGEPVRVSYGRRRSGLGGRGSYDAPAGAQRGDDVDHDDDLTAGICPDARPGEANLVGRPTRRRLLTPPQVDERWHPRWNAGRVQPLPSALSVGTPLLRFEGVGRQAPSVRRSGWDRHRPTKHPHQGELALSTSGSRSSAARPRWAVKTQRASPSGASAGPESWRA